MGDKRKTRLRRATKIRSKIARQGAVRLSVHRTPRHFYAQLFDQTGQRVLVAASTLDPQVRKQLKYSGNAEAAGIVGAVFAKKAGALSIERVAFDRAGFRYHGRVKAFAEAARAHGLVF